MLTTTMLKRARESAEEGVAYGELVDATTVSIDATLPAEDRVRDYVKQVRNPYAFRVGEVAVRVRFAGGPTLDECLAHYAAELDRR